MGSKKIESIYVVECRKGGRGSPWMPLDAGYHTTCEEAVKKAREERERDPEWTYHIVCYRRSYVACWGRGL
jgi:hypothetical protein